MNQWIFGKASPVSLSDQGKHLLKSSGCIVSDYVGESGSPSNGILCSFKSVPIAFWDVPTLNQMVFSRKLWECLLENQYLKQSMENGSHWGEAKHADRDEVYLDEIACRVNRFWIGSNNILLGDVDIPDTPKGRIVHSLARISRVGISSRGFGELRDMDNGLKEVIPDQYMHVCWDMVAFPAVPDAHMTLITGDSPMEETINMSMELRKLINEAYQRHPKDKALQKLVSSTMDFRTEFRLGVNGRRAMELLDMYADEYEGRLISFQKMVSYLDEEFDNPIKREILEEWVRIWVQSRNPVNIDSGKRHEISRNALETALVSHELKKRKFYAPLYSRGGVRIMSAGTRSDIVEEIEKILCSVYPNKVWQLTGVVPDNGWYLMTYLSMDKSRMYNTQFLRTTFRIRRNPNGTWNITVEE